MEDAFSTHGSAIMKMTAETEQMKKNAIIKTAVLENLPAKITGVFLIAKCVTESMIAKIQAQVTNRLKLAKIAM